MELMTHAAPLGKRIRRARDVKGWSRSELSRRTNIPGTTLRHIEESKKSVKTSEENLRTLADALDLPYEELRILAGYQVVPSPNIEEANHRLMLQLEAYPQFKRAIRTLIERGDAQEIDAAAEYLEFQQQHRRRGRR